MHTKQLEVDLPFLERREQTQKHDLSSTLHFLCNLEAYFSASILPAHNGFMCTDPSPVARPRTSSLLTAISKDQKGDDELIFLIITASNSTQK